jgi:hypothetical protein
MILTSVVVLVAFFALLLIVVLAKGHASADKLLDNPSQHMRSVDIEAFRNLIDPEEEDFLRRNLAAAEFRTIQRERLLAAVEYVAGAAHNAALLLRLGEAARHSADPATAQAAEQLVDNALRLRLYSFQVLARLYVGMIIPGVRTSPVRIAERYEQMTRQVVMLGCLQYPTRGVSAAM